MSFRSVVWDSEDDPDGNAQHCAEHGVSIEEVESVLGAAIDADVSRSSGWPCVFGDAFTGRHLIVVFERIDSETAYPITAYEVPRRKRK